MSKHFIDISPMKKTLLAQLQQTFLATEHYNSDVINISLSLKDVVEKEVNEKKLTEPTIYILDSAWLKIQMLVKENSGEVAWHCLVEKHTDNRYLIYDVLVFPQEVTGTTADGVDGDYEMWVATLPDEQFDYMRCHMHSHVNMGVTPSGVDENYYSKLMTQVSDYYITMIINKAGNYHLRFYDKENNIMWSELEFIICNKDGRTYDDWYESVKEKIKDRPVVTRPLTGSSYQHTLYDYDRDWGYSSSYKKKETQTKTTIDTTTSNQPGFVLTSPFGECLVFKDVNEATNYIYKHYEKDIRDYKAFQRNHIRTRLAHDDYVCINKTTLEFIDDIYADSGILGYAVTECDIWEVG